MSFERTPSTRFVPIACALRAFATPVALVLSLLVHPNLAKAEEAVSKSYPVTVLKLEKRDFTRETRLTGSVDLYRQEKVGFEVSGRVQSVLDIGHEVTGPSFDETGRQVRQGDIIARLDGTRYRQRVAALEARLASLRKSLKAERIDVEQVAQANLKAAVARMRIAESEISAASQQVDETDAELVRSRKELVRQKQLAGGLAGRQKLVDDALAAYDSANARKQQHEAALAAKRQALDAQRATVSIAEATISLKQAQVESTEGRIQELQETLKTARKDLEDAVLYAPFTGRITALHATQGAVISNGSPIVTLSLMDPIQVRVEVSADADRFIRTGDQAWLYPKDPVNPERKSIQVNALVFEKGAVADSKTRTFRIDLMARNQRRRIEHLNPSTRGLPVAEEYLPVARRYEGEEGPLFVPTQSFYREKGRTYVFRLPGVSFHSGARRSAAGKHMPEKVEVEPGDDYFTVIKWNFRSLKQSGNLKEGDFLVLGPRKEMLSGLAIGRPQWLLRPGDLVPVRFVIDTTPQGYYVPVNAITLKNDAHIIFAVVSGKAKQITISVHDTYGELRRIEGAALKTGLQVVIGGVHYVSEGDRLSVVGEQRLVK